MIFSEWRLAHTQKFDSSRRATHSPIHTHPKKTHPAKTIRTAHRLALSLRYCTSLINSLSCHLVSHNTRLPERLRYQYHYRTCASAKTIFKALTLEPPPQPEPLYNPKSSIHTAISTRFCLDVPVAQPLVITTCRLSVPAASHSPIIRKLPVPSRQTSHKYIQSCEALQSPKRLKQRKESFPHSIYRPRTPITIPISP